MALWILDVKSLCVLDANATACTLYGYSRDDIVGKSARELRPSEEVERFEKYVIHEVSQGLDTQTERWDYFHRQHSISRDSIQWL
jgi:PAS domain S-box-containing protein